MKNFEVIELSKRGILNVTTHSIGTKDAISVFKFKKALRSCIESINSDESALLTECGIDDAASFDSKRGELLGKAERSREEDAELEALNEKFRRFIGMCDGILMEEAKLDTVNTMQYEAWKSLQDENKSVNVNGEAIDVFSGEVEMLLLGVLWEEPEI